MEYDTESPSQFTSFKLVTIPDVIKLIKESQNKQCALDPIPTSLLKKCSNELAPVICNIINSSLESATVPSEFKCALVTPLIKKPDAKYELKNYRPVSNLPYVSKLVEKVVSVQLKSYKEDNGLNEELQSAYKKNHSTQTALLKVFDEILTKMDKQEVVFLTLLDLSAAFDTVDHSILLQRLNHTFGIKGKAFKWIQSYLSVRKQKVVINGKESVEIVLDCNVPQGSVLGADFYSDYTKPEGNLMRFLNFLYHFYADDSQLVNSVVPNDLGMQKEIQSSIENAVKEIGKWLRNNKLKMNENKTEFIVFGTAQQLKKVQIDSIRVGEDEIKAVPKVRNLGVMMDQKLDMSAHVSYLCKICFYRIKSLYKVRKYLTVSATKTIVQALVTSKLDYCNSLLFGISQKLMMKLQRVQNAAARLVMCSSKRTSVKPILQKLHWLPIEARINYSIALNVYKAQHDLAPNYIKELIKPYKPLSGLRSSERNLLEVPRYKLKTCGLRAFSYAGPVVWNGLPEHIKNQETIDQFKKQLKTFYFKKHYFSC